MTETFDLSDSDLHQCLEKNMFKGCGPQEPSSLGWVPPMGEESTQLAHGGSGMYLLTAKREERIMPPGAVKDAVNEKVAEIESREARKLGRKQRMEIREDMIFSMMPRAFTRSTLIQGIIMPEQNLIVVDCANRNKAEEWLSLLRESLGGLSTQPVEVNRSVSGLLTAWLSGNTPLPAEIEPGDECELQSVDEEKSVVVCRRQELTGDEVKSHLKAGKIVIRMAINWKQSMSFVLNESLEIKKLRFSDTMVEQSSAQASANDKATELDTRFNLMALEFSRFLPGLWLVFGGLEDD